MTDIKAGDRVKVEFEGEVYEVGEHYVHVTSDDQKEQWPRLFSTVGPEHVTKVTPPMPTRAGTVLKEVHDGGYTIHFKDNNGDWHSLRNDGVYVKIVSHDSLELAWKRGVLEEVVLDSPA